MLKKSVRAVAALALFAAASGCEKTDIDPSGYWEITWISSLTASGSEPQKLCQAGGRSTMAISGNIYHNFRYNGSQYPKYANPGVQANVVFGLSENESLTISNLHDLQCSDLSVRIYNRAWAGSLFGVDNSYGHLEQAPNGGCIVVADKNWDYRIVGVSIEIKNERNVHWNDPSVNDNNNNFGYFEYDCQTGGYSNGRMASTSANATVADKKPSLADVRAASAQAAELKCTNCTK